MVKSFWECLFLNLTGEFLPVRMWVSCYRMCYCPFEIVSFKFTQQLFSCNNFFLH